MVEAGAQDGLKVGDRRVSADQLLAGGTRFVIGRLGLGPPTYTPEHRPQKDLRSCQLRPVVGGRATLADQRGADLGGFLVSRFSIGPPAGQSVQPAQVLMA